MRLTRGVVALLIVLVLCATALVAIGALNQSVFQFIAGGIVGAFAPGMAKDVKTSLFPPPYKGDGTN